MDKNVDVGLILVVHTRVNNRKALNSANI